MLFDICRYLTDKYFDIVWGTTPPGTPRNEPPKNHFFERLNFGFPRCLMSVGILETNILTQFGGATPPATPPKWTHQN